MPGDPRSSSGRHAIIGPRSNRTFEGLPLQARLDAQGMKPRCRLHVDFGTGGVAHWRAIEGIATELCDVIALAGRCSPEHIIVPVDAIIDPATFDALQAQLKARNPKMVPPRVVTGPILLTGIATCATCGGGMTLRTGKSGRYRYYACAAAAQKGKTACRGRSVPVDKLDDAVMDRVADQLLTPARVADMLRGLMDRRTRRDADYADRLAALRGKLAEAEIRLGRLYQAIENGITDSSDPTLKDRVAAIKTERDTAKVAFDRAVSEMSPDARITEEKIAAFVGTMRDNVLSGDTPFRRAWLRAVIDNVEVDDTEIRIHGRRTVLERLVMAGGAAPAGVPSFVRKWRTRQDSNL